MAIFRECKHSFQIVQALFGKSASTLVFFDCNAAIEREQWKACFPIAEREQGRCDSSKGTNFA